MPRLRTYRLFISHCWEYDADYYALVRWLDQEPLLEWKNLSVPEASALPEDRTFQRKLRSRIGRADALLIVAGMEIAQRYWVRWEIECARVRAVPIIGILPIGARRIPSAVQDTGCPMVRWRRDSVVRAIRDYAL